MVAGHEVTICPPPGQYEGNEDKYEIECESCDYIGSTFSFEEAECIKRLHEEFVAVLVAQWEIPAWTSDHPS